METRERILRAACEVFSELGYEAATLEAIADRSDLTRPAINYHFPGKRLLYAEVLRRTTASVVTASAERAREVPATLVARLTAFIASAVQVDRSDHAAAAFLVAAVLESRWHPELAQLSDDPMRDCRQFITWAVDEAVSSGELSADTDSAVLVEMLIALLWGLGFYAGFAGDHHQLEQITVALEKLLTGQLSSSPNPPAPRGPCEMSHTDI